MGRPRYTKSPCQGYRVAAVSYTHLDDQDSTEIGLDKDQKERNAQVDAHLAKEFVDVATGRKEAIKHDGRIRNGKWL